MSVMSRRAVVAAVGGSAVSWGAISLSRGWPWAAGPGAGSARTSFGTVVVLGSSRIEAAAPGAAHVTSSHGGADALVPSAVHGAWTAGVLIDVSVRNRLRRPVELSPGQFRVRVDRDGPTVSLYSSDRDAEPLEPGAARTLRITYLAPPPDLPLSLLFEDPGARRPVDLGPVGATTRAGVWS